MSQPQILLVPTQCELEWRIAPSLREWADVATFDPPGVGDAPPVESPGAEALQERGRAEIEDRGWNHCVVVGDEFGVHHAVQIAAKCPDAVAGLALGHACLSLSRDGDRAPVNGEVWGAMTRLRDTDYRTYARHLTQVTRGAYDDEMTDRYIERVPHGMMRAYGDSLEEHSEESMEPLIASLDVPLLFAKHDGCLVFTDEGWDDAVAAFPGASTLKTVEKPSASPDFAAELRSFCSGLEG